MNLCIVNEDHPQCNVPRKAIKACPGRGRGTLSHLERGHTVPFLHRTSVVCVNLLVAAITHGSRGPESTSLTGYVKIHGKKCVGAAGKGITWFVQNSKCQ